MKRKDNRKSRGVAFILFLKPEDAQECVKSVNNSIVSSFTFKEKKKNNAGLILIFSVYIERTSY